MRARAILLAKLTGLVLPLTCAVAPERLAVLSRVVTQGREACDSSKGTEQ